MPEPEDSRKLTDDGSLSDPQAEARAATAVPATPPTTLAAAPLPDLYRVLAKLVWLAAGVVILLWFLSEAIGALLFFLLAMILAIALNAPVTWMEQRRIPRPAGVALVCLAIVAVVSLLAWLVVPRLIHEAAVFGRNVPTLVENVSDRIENRLHQYPEVEKRLRIDEAALMERLLPPLQKGLAKVGKYSLSAVGLVLFSVLLIATVLYALLRPRPLLEGYLSLFPLHLRDPAARAFSRGSQTVIGWIWADVTIGTIEGILATAFLTIIGVPGAIIWGAFTFFAELIPKLGPYIMAVPPALVAFAVEPVKALWVILGYMAIQTFAGDIIGPFIRGRRMDVHPVSIIFGVLAMGSVFGLLGALIATPVTGFVKAYFDEFYRARRPQLPEPDPRVEDMLTRRPSRDEG